MVTSPHNLASEAGLRVLRDGGNAIEATVAMAASLAVVYPHMTWIGGDGFWLIYSKGMTPLALDACGGAAKAASAEVLSKQRAGSHSVTRCVTSQHVAGTLSGWDEALRISKRFGGKLPLSRLVEDAAWYGANGFPVTATQEEAYKNQTTGTERFSKF
jgi:gamma-glutamyltranspeptidase/glutathione hydrolase